MPTPEEVAATVNKPAVQRWLLEPTRTPREILTFMQNSPAEGHSAELARTVLQVRVSEIAEVSTKRIVRLTWALVALTVALLVFTAYLYKDTHALVEREQTAAPNKKENP